MEDQKSEVEQKQQVKPFTLNFSSGEGNTKTTTISMHPEGVHLMARAIYAILQKSGMEVQISDNFSDKKDE